MPCFHPLHGYYAKGGGRIVFGPSQGHTDRPMTIPCGNCLGCRLDRARDWSIRAMHEASQHPLNTFVTLTYATENLPENNSLDHRDFQLFMKTLRNRADKPMRFLMCGEYGPETERPHYHAIIFGLHFHDRKEWKLINGNMHYTSSSLDDAWKLGHASCTDLTVQAAGYVARYVMKKQTGEKGRDLYDNQGRKAPYLQMSRGGGPRKDGTKNPGGIGTRWFEKYASDIYPCDFVVFEGKKYAVPKFYDGLLKKHDPDALERLKHRRIARASRNSADTTPERLAVRKQVLIGKTKALTRGNPQ